MRWKSFEPPPQIRSLDGTQRKFICCERRCIKAFSETDFTKDLEEFDVPTLILHGDDDQIVPIDASALLSSRIIKGATLKIYPSVPHGMCSTLKDQVNADLLAFFKA
ncbi:MAG TPA: alpha/beta hydrolase [Geobacteraceae bacterium]|nr:alpha/beta hydrolase [Geobacteraceae bacterium]